MPRHSPSPWQYQSCVDLNRTPARFGGLSWFKTEVSIAALPHMGQMFPGPTAAAQRACRCVMSNQISAVFPLNGEPGGCEALNSHSPLQVRACPCPLFYLWFSTEPSLESEPVW